MEIEKISKIDHVFIFENADHTLGNLLKKEIMNDVEVVYVGYDVPHPLKKQMKLRITTKEKSPKEILYNALNRIFDQLNQIDQKLLT